MMQRPNESHMSVLGLMYIEPIIRSTLYTQSFDLVAMVEKATK